MSNIQEVQTTRFRLPRTGFKCTWPGPGTRQNLDKTITYDVNCQDGGWPVRVSTRLQYKELRIVQNLDDQPAGDLIVDLALPAYSENDPAFI